MKEDVSAHSSYIGSFSHTCFISVYACYLDEMSMSTNLNYIIICVHYQYWSEARVTVHNSKSPYSWPMVY